MKKSIAMIVVAASCVFHTGCASGHWDGQISRWGTLREVLRDGQSQGRVHLSEISHEPHAFGIGALEGLKGEILIQDGRVWICECENSNKLNTYDQPQSDTQATLLAVSYVPAWKKIRVDQTVTNEQFDTFIDDLARNHGLSNHDVIPFKIEGDFQHLSVHVLNGQCPLAAAHGGPSLDRQPYRNEWHDVSATLVGFYGKDQAGILTHHDSNTHVHALIDHDFTIIGHVDGLELKPGSMIYLPDQ